LQRKKGVSPVNFFLGHDNTVTMSISATYERHGIGLGSNRVKSSG
jgi:hypothetical protein